MLLPLVGHPLRFDHRFNVFLYGGNLTQRPWEVITGPLASIPNYLDHGNFRPLGRMVEQGQDYLAFSLSRSFDVPLPVALRLVAFGFAILLTLAAVLWAETLATSEQVWRRPPSAAAFLAALAVPLFLVGTTSSATVLFTSLYLCSAALVLLFAVTAARIDWLRPGAVGAGTVAGAVLLGAAAGAFNEITYLAVPVAVVTVAARGLLTLRMSVPELLRSAAARLLLAATLGFAAVVLPVRVIIAQRCADGGCYSASDLSLSEETLGAWGHRILSVLPSNSWAAAGASPADWLTIADVAPLLALGLVALLAVLLGRGARSAPLPAPWAIAALAVAGIALLAGTSLAMALTTEIQQRVSAGRLDVGRGWRDLGLVAAGGAVLITAAGLVLARWGAARGHRTAATTGVVAVVAVAAMITLSVNVTVAAEQRPTPDSELFDRISVELLHHNPEDDEERCAMLEEFVDLNPGQEDTHSRLDRALESASTAWHGTPFCVGDQP